MLNLVPVGTPYSIPVDVCVPCVLGFGGLLSNRCRISAPVDLIGRTQVRDNEEYLRFTIYHCLFFRWVAATERTGVREVDGFRS